LQTLYVVTSVIYLLCVWIEYEAKTAASKLCHDDTGQGLEIFFKHIK